MSYIVRQQCKRSLLWFLLAYRAVVLSRVNSTSIKRRGCQRRTQCPHLFTDQKQILHLFHVLIYLRGSRAGEFVWFWELLLPVSSLPTPPSVLPSSQNVALLPFIIIHPCTIISEDATVRDFCLCPRCILSVARRAYGHIGPKIVRTRDTLAPVPKWCRGVCTLRHQGMLTPRQFGPYGETVQNVGWTVRYLGLKCLLETSILVAKCPDTSDPPEQCRSVSVPICLRSEVSGYRQMFGRHSGLLYLSLRPES